METILKKDSSYQAFYFGQTVKGPLHLTCSVMVIVFVIVIVLLEI
jgi:hypothetical protein